jgi:hypothetical protein
MKTLAFITSVLLLAASSWTLADCVNGAKDKTKFSVLDNHTVILQGGYGSEIIVKTFCSINNTSNLTVLKDDFCSHDNAVIYVDGEVCDVKQVTKVQ